MVQMITNSSQSSSDIENTLSYVTKSSKKEDKKDKEDKEDKKESKSERELKASLELKYKSIANNSTFTVFTLGGNAQVVSEIFTDHEKIGEIIRENSTFSKSNPGAMISYTVKFLNGNKTARIMASTTYIETECIEYPNGYIDLEHGAGYVAKLYVTWRENGIQKRYESGQITAGWSKRLYFPGDVDWIQINGQGATGLAWDTWWDNIRVVENGPTNKCYRITGTTLNQSWRDC